MSPKGSYWEGDVIAFLDKHPEPWKEGCDWPSFFADDYAALKSENTFLFSWQRGYVLSIRGGGATLVSQTPNTDSSEHVRRRYGNKECALMMENAPRPCGSQTHSRGVHDYDV